MITPKHVIISRTDSIGDVVLTLPMAKALKDAFPGVKVSFLGKKYTQPVIEACEFVDAFIDVNGNADILPENEAIAAALPDGGPEDVLIHVFPKAAIAKAAAQKKYGYRIGTTNRLFHWWTCNKLVKLSRKNSNLHESQLNLKLLKPLGIRTDYSTAELSGMVGISPQVPLPIEVESLIGSKGKNIILHPKSQGSAREWSLSRYTQLARKLHEKGYQVFVTGTEKERDAMQPFLSALSNIVIDMTGKLNLAELITFISRCDALVAASTGPLHLAGALGKIAIGIYPSKRPMHPGRWRPLGSNGIAVGTMIGNCPSCQKKMVPCTCLDSITEDEILEELEEAETGFSSLFAY